MPTLNTADCAALIETLTKVAADAAQTILDLAATAKARIKAQEATVQNVLRHCLATSLQLLHPMMPFITEELWTHVAGNGSLLVTHSFPLVHGSLNDPAAEAQMQLVQAITSAIREIQNRYPAAKGKPIVLQPRDAATQALIEKSRGIIEPLTSAQIASLSYAGIAR